MPAAPLILRIEGMDCADCALHLQEASSRVAGVEEVQVFFTTGQMKLLTQDGVDALPQVQEVARQMGYRVLPVERREPAQETGLRGWLRRRRRDGPVAVAALLLLTALAVRLLAGVGWLVDALLVVSTLVAGLPAARTGWATLRLTRRPDMNVLMSMAALGALTIGEYTEGAVVTFLFALGNLLESLTMERARGAIRGLMNLSPLEATRLAADGEERVAVEELAVGERVLVRPGERIPVDGQVLAGRSAVNQAVVTGESLPVDKAPGDDVLAGTVNGSGALTVEVRHAAADSTVARVVRLVEEAQQRPALSQRFVDRFARVYTPLVVAVALLIAVLPPLLGLGGFVEWFYRALVLLVIACPCALVISTPVAVVSGLAAAARGGVLVKGGAHLEQLGRLRTVAFDKTGTLTRGEPRLVDWRCSLDEPPPPLLETPVCLDLLAKAAAVEQRSEHPLARAVVEGAARFGVDQRYAAAEDVEATAGLGVRGRVDGHEIAVGSHFYLHGNWPAEPFCAAAQQAAAARGQTAVLVEDVCCGRMAYGLVADTLRQEVPAVMQALKRAGIVHTVMLTGDNPAAAATIAQAAGVDDVRAGLLPEQKVAVVEELLSTDGAVAMVGDGVNDAPALARATVGIAMGAAGSDVVLETADVALMGDDLHGLPYALRLSRRVAAIIRQNVVLSLLTKGVFMALALTGVATLWMAVFADMGVSLLVTLNGMRALAQRR